MFYDISVHWIRTDSWLTEVEVRKKKKYWSFSL